MKGDTLVTTLRLLMLLALIVIICMMVTGGNAEVLEVRTVQARGGLNVRVQPNINSRIIYLLEDTETVIVRERRDGWALVARNDGKHLTIGWVNADYLK